MVKAEKRRCGCAASTFGTRSNEVQVQSRISTSVAIVSAVLRGVLLGYEFVIRSATGDLLPKLIPIAFIGV